MSPCLWRHLHGSKVMSLFCVFPHSTSFLYTNLIPWNLSKQSSISDQHCEIERLFLQKLGYRRWYLKCAQKNGNVCLIETHMRTYEPDWSNEAWEIKVANLEVMFCQTKKYKLRCGLIRSYLPSIQISSNQQQRLKWEIWENCWLRVPSFNNLRAWDRRLDSSADQYYILLKQAIQGTEYTVVPELWLEKKKKTWTGVTLCRNWTEKAVRIRKKKRKIKTKKRTSKDLRQLSTSAPV